MLYNAFMSYSHAADTKLAAAIQSALRRFAKPWYRFRILRIFRDKTNLAASPALWTSIQHALENSEYFLFLASPQSADSTWVQREIDWWPQNRSAAQLIILLTGGRLLWDRSKQDFD